MSRLAMITFLSGPDAPVDPGYGVGGGGNYPTTGPIYGGGRPDQSLPGGGHITTLPVFPFDPTIDNSLPGSQPGPDNTLPGGGARPDNELPRPGKRYIVKWLCGSGLILVPDHTLPETPVPEPK